MKRSEAILRVRDVLLKRREALRKSVSGKFNLPNRDDVKTVGDEIDAAVESAHEELVSQIVAAESRELQRIDIALEKIRQGAYGVCEHCNKNIQIARLQAVPYATLCVKCQHEMEVSGELDDNGSYVNNSRAFDGFGVDVTDDVLS